MRPKTHGVASRPPTCGICPYCKRRQHLIFDTDFNGNMVESFRCGCAEKRSRGLCIDCSVFVGGRRWRCERCKSIAPRKAALRRAQEEKDRQAMIEEDAELGFHSGYYTNGKRRHG